MDIFNLPDNDANNRIFYPNGTGTTAWQTWVKPKNAKFIHIQTIGGGGGGGSSPNTGVSTVRGGGGGGGCSSVANGIFIASLLPDILYIKVGAGGVGGILGTSGGAGEISYVSVQPNNLRTNVVLANGNSGGGGGAGGTSFVGGPGGAAGTVLTQNNCGLSYLGAIIFFVGQIGLAGGVTNGTTNSYGSFILPMGPGCGGAGVNGSNTTGTGGGTTGGGVFPSIPGGSQSTSTPAGDGSGYSSFPSSNTNRVLPMFSMGGSGGGSSSLSSGGNGGNGGFGSGGGGGGGGVNAPGRGGNGGDGLVIITCF
jgi:hypothetical protein